MWRIVTRPSGQLTEVLTAGGSNGTSLPFPEIFFPLPNPNPLQKLQASNDNNRDDNRNPTARPKNS